METIPCLGSVDISLLEAPTVDLALMLINQLDIMAFPGLNLAANLALKMVSCAECTYVSMPCSLSGLDFVDMRKPHCLSTSQQQISSMDFKQCFSMMVVRRCTTGLAA